MDTIDDVPLGALRVLEAVAAHGGFAASGRQLGLSRAAVSRMASHLETLVGVRLFRRTTRRVVLTDAATQLAARLSPTLPAMRQALELASADELHLAGLVRVSVSHAFGRRYVVPSIARFVALEPAVQLSDRIKDLVAEPIDVAVRPELFGSLMTVSNRHLGRALGHRLSLPGREGAGRADLRRRRASAGQRRSLHE